MSPSNPPPYGTALVNTAFASTINIASGGAFLLFTPDAPCRFMRLTSGVGEGSTDLASLPLGRTHLELTVLRQFASNKSRKHLQEHDLAGSESMPNQRERS